MTKILFYILLLFPVGSCYSQSDTLNQVDSKGMKQGYWVSYGSRIIRPWCDTCKFEEGIYLNNKKEGDWIKYHPDGATPKLKVTYINSKPIGHYTKFHANGNIKETGNIIKNKHSGGRIIYYESGCVQMEQNFNENGKPDSVETYYYNCAFSDSMKGQVEIHHKLVNGASREVIRFYPNGEKKEIITYAEDGTILKAEKLEQTKAPFVKGKVAKTNNGYHSVYPDDELYEDGEFRNGKLWNGKKYIYDSDGILLRIEIWKEGKYYSDGQFEDVSVLNQSDTLNQIDTAGMKQGYWIVYGIDKPQNIWCDSCKIEEGNYLNNRKDGDWIKYYQDGITPKLKVAYTRGRPSGYYTKIYPNGNIRESGNFVRGKYKGIYIRYYSSGCIQGETIYNDLGEKEEEYFYYNNCDTAVSLKGKVASGIIQYNSIGGFSIYNYYPNGKLKKVEEVDSLGNVTSRIQRPITEPLPVIKPTNNNSLCPDLTIVEKKKHIKKDSYNKLYNLDYDIYMDGEFKNGCLWDGKYYIYDSNGLLIKIEIWKNGKYHSDGQL